MKLNVITTLSIIIFSLCSCKVIKSDIENVDKISKSIENKLFTVSFNYVNPMRMQSIALTSEYTLTIKGDSAFAYLPYYGVVHTAPFNMSDGGIKFASAMQKLDKRLNKKHDGWEIRFKIDKPEYHYNLHLTVYKNGSSTLQVNSYDKDPISYFGEIEIK